MRNDRTQRKKLNKDFTLLQEKVVVEFHLDHLLHIAKPFERDAYTH